jgi:excisionase family DNA binding protein
MLYDYILITNPRKKIQSSSDLRELICLMAETVNHAQPVRAYTTGELARVFGITVQAVNKWIDEGRFPGYRREGKNRHNRIPETFSVVMRTGETLKLREAVTLYEQQTQEQGAVMLTAEQQRDVVLDEIVRLMKKYRGTYEMTIRDKTQRTIEEERDASIWLVLLDELREMNEAP